jgi:hypothetical protein
MPKIKVKVNARKGEKKNFRRAGIEFTPEWTEHEVTDEQLAAIEAEPMLEVEAAEAPADPQERQERIIEAIKGLDRGNDDLFTQQGAPKVEVIEKALGFNISSEERNEAWGKCSEGQE